MKKRILMVAGMVLSLCLIAGSILWQDNFAVKAKEKGTALYLMETEYSCIDNEEIESRNGIHPQHTYTAGANK